MVPCRRGLRADRAGVRRGTEKAEPWENAQTIADGLRVPQAIGDFLVLRAMRESGGTAVAVADAEMVAGMRELGALEGISAAPEGGAALHALPVLVERGTIGRTDTVVLFNTGGALKYLDVLSGSLHRWHPRTDACCLALAGRHRNVIGILFTGGTISMRDDPAGRRACRRGRSSSRCRAWPVADIEIEDFSRLPGPHVTPEQMWRLARRAAAWLERPDIDGLVITHGTDTIEETAFFSTSC